MRAEAWASCGVTVIADGGRPTAVAGARDCRLLLDPGATVTYFGEPAAWPGQNRDVLRVHSVGVSGTLAHRKLFSTQGGRS